MTFRTVYLSVCIALALTAAHGQTNNAAQTAQSSESAQRQARETPPDSKAYTDASRINDPVKKIAALEKFKTDFPNSNSIANANLAILSTLAQRMPDQTTRIRDFAKGLYDAAPDEKAKASLAGQIAESLLTNKVLLQDAEQYATTYLDGLKEADYIAGEKAQPSRRGGRENGQPPSDEDLAKRFREARATRQSTLGRVEFQLGKIDEAKKLLNESYAANANQPLVQAALGEIAAKDGDDAKALDLLVSARLSGHSTSSANAVLAEVYAKAHNGSAAGLTESLDAEYNKRFPNPVQVSAYQPTEKRTDRLVVGEIFTGSGCPPCVGADLAFDAALSRYSRKDFVVVMYHEHVPQPDPMSNPDTQARSKYYGVTGVPTYAVDGTTVKYSGADRDGAKQVFEHIREPIEKNLEIPAEAVIALKASENGNAVTVSATVNGVKSDSQDLKVHVLLLEKELTYSGENGIRFHPMVVRAMGGKDDDGFALTPGIPLPVEQNWDLEKVSAGLKTHLDEYEAQGHRGNAFKFIEKKYAIVSTDLAVLVFVQDVKTRRILQAAYADLSPAGRGATDNDERR
jgi:thiol-disulfide isomerase/thioredoxin